MINTPTYINTVYIFDEYIEHKFLYIPVQSLSFTIKDSFSPIYI